MSMPSDRFRLHMLGLPRIESLDDVSALTHLSKGLIFRLCRYADHFYTEVPDGFGRYSADSPRDNSKFSFQLLATRRAAHRPWLAAGSALAPAESLGWILPISTRRSRVLDWLALPSEWRNCVRAVSYTHLRAHETVLDLVC